MSSSPSPQVGLGVALPPPRADWFEAEQRQAALVVWLDSQAGMDEALPVVRAHNDVAALWQTSADAGAKNQRGEVDGRDGESGAIFDGPVARRISESYGSREGQE